MFECAVLFGMLSQHNTSTNPNAGEIYADVSQVLNMASSSLYPGPLDAYKQDVSKARDEMLQLRKSEDQQKQFYLVRNCNDIARPSSIENAVAELMLAP